MSERPSAVADDNGIEGKVIAITGASSGIGAAIAEHLAQRGASVVLGARSEDRLAEIVASVQASGGEASALGMDVRHRDGPVRLVAAARQRYGRLDVLVSNAGSMAISAFDELRQDDWDDLIATNLTGVLNGIGAALPVFRAQESGQFVNIASTSGHRIVPTQGVYAAAKTGVRVLSEALRQEAGPNLRVTIISPGMTDTEVVRSGRAPKSRRSLNRRPRSRVPSRSPSSNPRASTWAKSSSDRRHRPSSIAPAPWPCQRSQRTPGHQRTIASGH